MIDREYNQLLWENYLKLLEEKHELERKLAECLKELGELKK